MKLKGVTAEDFTNYKLPSLFESDEAILTMLPAHADLKRTYTNLNRGDFIHVEVTEIIPPKKEGGYPKRIYKVLVDDDRKVEWPDDDSSYEAETVSDDYYA